MTRHPVQSSNIKSVGYDPVKKEMEVEFHSGEIYAYHHVEPHTYKGLIEASSVGSYFHKHVRPHHQHTKR